MNARRRRFLWISLTALIAGSVSMLLAFRGSDPITPPTIVGISVPPSPPDVLGVPPVPAAPSATTKNTGGPRFQLLDVATMAPVAELEVSERRGKSEPTNVKHRTDKDGWVTTGDRTESVVPVSSDWVVLATDAIAKDAGPGTAHKSWIARLVKVTVSVQLESPELRSKGKPIRLVSGPAARPPGTPMVATIVPGNPLWLKRLNKKLVHVTAESSSDTITYDQLALDDVAILVSAPGHESSILFSSFYTSYRSDVTLTASLKRGVIARVLVTDPEGNPIENAMVEWIEDREDVESNINIIVENMIHDERRTGLVVLYEEDRARVAHTISAETKKDGRFQGGPIVQARRRYLGVWAAGFVPYLRAEDSASMANERTIVLERSVPRRASYRFVHDGVPITAGTLGLAERLDGLTPAVPDTPSEPDGTFSSAFIVPGKEYFVILRTGGGRPHTGWTTFGDQEVIDTSTLRAR